MPARQPIDQGRRTPAKGVHIMLGRPNWVFLTVCTEKRSPWLAQAPVQNALHRIWKDQATAWLVSDYVLMPDHLHLFCAPHDLKFKIEKWMGYWKHCFLKTHPGLGAFQAGGFHHRLRDDENYAEKWQYARENPVRQGLVSQAIDWPFWGRVHDIRI
jgi:REP element-mobilizing transposase RayT